MGDDSSPTTDTEEQSDQIDVDSARVPELTAEAEHNDRSAHRPSIGHSGLLGVELGDLLGMAFLSFLLGAAVEFGKRVGRDLYRSHY